jgi:hypothetical protein
MGIFYACAVAFGLVPYVFLAGLVRGRWIRGRGLGALMGWLGQAHDAGALRVELGRALGDPSVELAYWLPDSGQHVDAEGRRLRRLVIEELAGVDEAWWPSRLPGHIAADAESRRRAELESPVSVRDTLHQIMFLNLGELFDVIAERRNWDEVFRIALGTSRSTLDAQVRVLTAVQAAAGILGLDPRPRDQAAKLGGSSVQSPAARPIWTIAASTGPSSSTVQNAASQPRSSRRRWLVTATRPDASPALPFTRTVFSPSPIRHAPLGLRCSHPRC